MFDHGCGCKKNDMAMIIVYHCHVSSFPVITCMTMFDIDMAGDLQLRKFCSGSCLAPPPETIAPAFHSQDSAKKGRSTDQLTLRWKQHILYIDCSMLGIYKSISVSFSQHISFIPEEELIAPFFQKRKEPGGATESFPLPHDSSQINFILQVMNG